LGSFYFFSKNQGKMQPGKMRSTYFFISSLLIGLFSFPFAFVKPIEKKPKRLFTAVSDSTDYMLSAVPALLSVYDSLQLYSEGINRRAFEFAQKGYNKLREQGIILNDSIISIIDFSLPSTEKRLYILDLKNYRLLFNTYVAHGRNSGKTFANSFSNNPASHKSSPGFYKTLDTYFGSNGFSLKLMGLEKGINDNAYRRAIIIHGASYVHPDFIKTQGYIGRSEGCPAVMQTEAISIINSIKDGTCLFIYNPQKSYQQRSAVLN
jgi:hypothetical protein